LSTTRSDGPFRRGTNRSGPRRKLRDLRRLLEVVAHRVGGELALEFHRLVPVAAGLHQRARGLHVGAQALAGETGHLFGKRTRRFEHRLPSLKRRVHARTVELHQAVIARHSREFDLPSSCGSITTRMTLFQAPRFALSSPVGRLFTLGLLLLMLGSLHGGLFGRLCFCHRSTPLIRRQMLSRL
jgi:hypothetical protein